MRSHEQIWDLEMAKWYVSERDNERHVLAVSVPNIGRRFDYRTLGLENETNKPIEIVRS